MSRPAHLKAISFAELCGLFFPPKTGSIWAQHLGDKLGLILKKPKEKEKKKKERSGKQLAWRK